MRLGFAVRGLSAALVLVGCAGAALAQAPSVTNLNIFRDFRDANDLGIPVGDVLQYGGSVVGGSAGVTIQGIFTSSTPGQSFSTGTIVCGPLVANPNFCSRDSAFSAARLNGTWEARFTNASGSATYMLPSVAAIPAQAVAFPVGVNISLDGQGRPTINWSVPQGAVVHSQRINVYDRNQRTAQGTAQVLETINLGPDVRSTTPATVFSPTGRYAFAIQLIQTRDGQPLTPTSQNDNILTRSSSFYAYGRPPAARRVFVPQVRPNNVFTFKVPGVTAQTPFLIDPAIAVGYRYETGPGDPNFATVTLPTTGGGQFVVSYEQAGQPVVVPLAAGVQHTFPTGGVPRFQVTGIDPAAGLNPSDGGAFITEISLVADGQFTGTMTPLTAGNTIFAATLPASRSIQVGRTATAFASIINTGPAATGCGIVPATVTPATFSYQTTDPATNALTGTPNTRVSIAAGATQTFVVSFASVGPMEPRDVGFGFNCLSSDTAPAIVGVNTLQMTFDANPVPDVVALAATAPNGGILDIASPSGAGAFAVATVNVGVAGDITVSADTAGVSLPLVLTVCQSNPSSGVCLAPPAPSLVITIGATATPTFSVFAQASGAIAFDPAVNRVFVRFKDAGGVTRGSTSVAVRTN